MRKSPGRYALVFGGFLASVCLAGELTVDYYYAPIRVSCRPTGKTYGEYSREAFCECRNSRHRASFGLADLPGLAFFDRSVGRKLYASLTQCHRALAGE